MPITKYNYFLTNENGADFPPGWWRGVVNRPSSGQGYPKYQGKMKKLAPF